MLDFITPGPLDLQKVTSQVTSNLVLPLVEIYRLSHNSCVILKLTAFLEFLRYERDTWYPNTKYNQIMFDDMQILPKNLFDP